MSLTNLIIVESPTKAKVISKYSNNNFKVIATYGHIRDLPRKFLGVSIKNNFAPTFYFLNGKKRLVEKIEKLAQNMKVIYIATDPDREGEAIGWHLVQTIKNFQGVYKRLLLHEISKEYLYTQIKQPSNLSISRVNAQLARRIIDRLFGYLISPICFKRTPFNCKCWKSSKPRFKTHIPTTH
jgi:DNA topoisomerase I